ncbi:hypothetical protein DPMN_049923, partial [Dreissena polymorpha]
MALGNQICVTIQQEKTRVRIVFERAQESFDMSPTLVREEAPGGEIILNGVKLQPILDDRRIKDMQYDQKQISIELNLKRRTNYGIN